MCTVSFLPTKSGFILSSNRDERSARPKANFPAQYNSKSGTLTFPQDGLAGGTWIALAPNKMICLLNGAFEKHHHNPPYRHSRGKVVLDAFDFESFEEFRANYSLENIEPHTLVMIEFDAEIQLTELRWDGTQKYIKSLDASKTHIWSSSTLYNQEIRERRASLFTKWCQDSKYTLANIRDFHLNGGVGDSRNDFRMQRENTLQTISFTQVLVENGLGKMIYEDLMTVSE
jgi:hypothetical protein